jgi:polyisoprenoid-binding protein YceI
MIKPILKKASAVSFAAGAVFAATFAANAYPASALPKSTVSAVFKQMNVPVEGKFNRFSADVHFDPSNAAGSNAKLDVDVASFDLGSSDYNKEVAGAEWFDAAHFAHATFISTLIKAGSNGTFNVTGKLTIKGKTTDVTVPVQYHKDGGSEVFDGVLPIKRLAYNIGTGDWKDTSVVADDVQIKFHIVSFAN